MHFHNTSEKTQKPKQGPGWARKLILISLYFSMASITHFWWPTFHLDIHQRPGKNTKYSHNYYNGPARNQAQDRTLPLQVHDSLPWQSEHDGHHSPVLGVFVHLHITTTQAAILCLQSAIFWSIPDPHVQVFHHNPNVTDVFTSSYAGQPITQ